MANDYKNFIPREGSGKEFLKAELERMIVILRKKHDVGQGVHVFKRLDGKSGQGPFQEVQAQIANLFAGRSSDKNADLDDEDDNKDEDQEKEKNRGGDLKNTIKSRKAF